MNKRIVSVIIVLSIFFSTFAISGYALGEEVVLPSGLKFGMSVSQATAVSGYDKYGLDDTFFEAYFKECNYEFSTESRLQGEATVGELPATVHVFFDGKGLKQVKYSFPVNENGSSSIVSDISAGYDYVEANLQSKYGNPLDVTTHKHAYMPVVDKPLYFSWFLSIFGGAYTSTETESISNIKHTLRSISFSDGSSVYIDHYVEERNGKHDHVLSYTYYDFTVEPNSTTNSTVGF